MSHKSSMAQGSLLILWTDFFLQGRMECLRVNQEHQSILITRQVWAGKAMWGMQRAHWLGDQERSVPDPALSQSRCVALGRSLLLGLSLLKCSRWCLRFYDFRIIQ